MILRIIYNFSFLLTHHIPSITKPCRLCLQSLTRSWPLLATSALLTTDQSHHPLWPGLSHWPLNWTPDFHPMRCSLFLTHQQMMLLKQHSYAQSFPAHSPSNSVKTYFFQRPGRPYVVSLPATSDLMHHPPSCSHLSPLPCSFSGVPSRLTPQSSCAVVPSDSLRHSLFAHFLQISAQMPCHQRGLNIALLTTCAVLSFSLQEGMPSGKLGYLFVHHLAIPNKVSSQ